MEVQNYEANSEVGRTAFGNLTNNVSARVATPPLGMMKSVKQRRRNTKAAVMNEPVSIFANAAIATTKRLVEDDDEF